MLGSCEREITEFSQIVDIRRHIIQSEDPLSSTWFQYGLDTIADSRDNFIFSDISSVTDTEYLSRGNNIVQILDRLLESHGFALVTFTILPLFTWTFFVFLANDEYWLLTRRHDKLVIEKWPYFRDDIVTLLDVKSPEDRAMLWNGLTHSVRPPSNNSMIYITVAL